jgi:hypothetical protein
MVPEPFDFDLLESEIKKKIEKHLIWVQFGVPQ